MADEPAVRVLIADDQEMVREGFSVLLGSRPGIEVVGEAVDGRDAVEKTAALRPDVALLDVRMPVMNGLEATREIVARFPGTKVLILTTYDLDEYVYEALRAGASGFLLKDAPARRLAEGVTVVAEGGALLAPTVTRRLIAEFSRLPAQRTGLRAPLRERVAELTGRETEVLALVAQGLSNAEIGEHIFVAESTVKTHVSRILEKLSLRDRTQAVVFAYESGVVAARHTAEQPGTGALTDPAELPDTADDFATGAAATEHAPRTDRRPHGA
jgi:DNA-binding NarL/FixJ family response regulator